MIKEIKMYIGECDGCKSHYEMFDGNVALELKDTVSDNIKEDGDWVLLRDGKLYCDDCCTTMWNDETKENEVFSKDTQSSGATFLGVAD